MLDAVGRPDAVEARPQLLGVEGVDHQEGAPEEVLRVADRTVPQVVLVVAVAQFRVLPGGLLVAADGLRPLPEVAVGEAEAVVGLGRAVLIAGGLLREEADEVSDAFATILSMRELARRESGEWATLWLAS